MSGCNVQELTIDLKFTSITSDNTWNPCQTQRQKGIFAMDPSEEITKLRALREEIASLRGFNRGLIEENMVCQRELGRLCKYKWMHNKLLASFRNNFLRRFWPFCSKKSVVKELDKMIRELQQADHTP